MCSPVDSSSQQAPSSIPPLLRWQLIATSVAAALALAILTFGIAGHSGMMAGVGASTAVMVGGSLLMISAATAVLLLCLSNRKSEPVANVKRFTSPDPAPTSSDLTEILPTERPPEYLDAGRVAMQAALRAIEKVEMPLEQPYLPTLDQLQERALGMTFSPILLNHPHLTDQRIWKIVSLINCHTKKLLALLKAHNGPRKNPWNTEAITSPAYGLMHLCFAASCLALDDLPKFREQYQRCNPQISANAKTVSQINAVLIDDEAESALNNVVSQYKRFYHWVNHGLAWDSKESKFKCLYPLGNLPDRVWARECQTLYQEYVQRRAHYLSSQTNSQNH